MVKTPYTHGMFCWNEIGTRDAAAAKTFYTGLFGWEATDVPMPGDEGGTYTILKKDGEDIAGLYRMQGPMFEGVPPHWMVYVWADDVDATAARVKELGGTLAAEPFDVPGVGRMAVCKDPTGAVFSLFHGTDHPGAAEMTGPGTFCWRELSTRSLDAAGTFYTSLFGWKTKVGMAAPGEYHELSLEGGKQFGGMMAMDASWGDVPSHWGLYVEVADIDACVAKAQEMGAKLLMPVTEIPTVGRFTTLLDPTGAALSVIQLSG